MLATLRRLAVAGTTSLAGASGAVAAGGYELVQPPQNTSTPDQVEVVEYFWLGCPHCYAFEPTIEDWAQGRPDNVAFVREAPPLNPSWETHSRAFYAAQALGHEDEFVGAMFEAIHERREPMRDPEKIADLAESLGMERGKFLSTMKSFGVETKMRRATQLAKGAGLTGVPAVVVNGKYRTSAQLAGGNAGMIDVIDETIATEKRAMGLE